MTTNTSDAAHLKNQTTSGGVPIEYEVRVQVGGLTESKKIILRDVAPQNLCRPDPPRDAGTLYLTDLIKKHDGAIMQSEPNGWRCWSCQKPAVSLTHSPMMCLHLTREQGGPRILDFAQPVCETQGKCDLEARQMMREMGATQA